MEKYRSRKFCVLLYPLEDETHKQALQFIENNYDYASIVHDLDYTDTGELKKPHTHIIISLSNAKWNTALAKDIGVTINYIQPCRNYEKALNYLIHYNDDSKQQYDIALVKGNLVKDLKKYIKQDGKDENTKATELLDYISNNGYITIKQFAIFCAESGYWDIFRRAGYIYIEIIKEHNIYYSNLTKLDHNSIINVRRYKDGNKS